MNEYERNWLAKFELEQKEEMRRCKSTRASQYLCDVEAHTQTSNQPLKYNKNKLHSLGGQYLVVLYLNYADINETCEELGVNKSTIKSTLLRLRKKLDELCISPLIFDSLMRQE